MTETKINLEESDLKFKLPQDNVFPVELFDGKDFEEIEEILKEFITIQDKEVHAERVLTPEELSEIRRQYGEIAEDKLPVLRDELDALIAEHKQKKEQMMDRISALNTQFSDLVHLAKSGTENYSPLADRTFRIPISGYYLTYTFTGTVFQLARVQKIPESQMYDLFNSSDKNKEAFAALGYEFPENPILNKKNYRVFEYGDEGNFTEVWEEDGKDIGFNHWKEDFVDEDTGEMVTIDRKERFKIPIEESPYKNGKTETQTGETDYIQEVVAEELSMERGKTARKNKG